jgi:hypothetical protein
MLTLNKVEFESANQLKIGLGEQTLNGKMVQKLATTLANTANQCRQFINIKFHYYCNPFYKVRIILSFSHPP